MEESSRQEKLSPLLIAGGRFLPTFSQLNGPRITSPAVTWGNNLRIYKCWLNFFINDMKVQEFEGSFWNTKSLLWKLKTIPTVLTCRSIVSCTEVSFWVSWNVLHDWLSLLWSGEHSHKNTAYLHTFLRHKSWTRSSGEVKGRNLYRDCTAI